MVARKAAVRAVVAGLLSPLMVAGACGGLLVGTAQADAAPLDPANPATPATVTADALPTVQIDGVVWSQVVVGNTVYVAGKFTRARPAGAAAGTQETVRNNLLAYDIRTGALITSFAPDLNAQALVVTASPDGSRVYVGGDFTRADGQTRNRIAAYSTATGQLLADFRPNVTSSVRAIAATDSTVYLGGAFTSVGSQSRHRLAAVSASNGALLPWNPVPGTGPLLNRNGSTATSDVVRALVVTSGGAQVVVGGHFDTLNGVKATGVGALDAVTGETRPFEVNRSITNQGINSGVFSLTTDGTNVYGTAYDFYGPGNIEGSFSVSADGGAVNWVNDCHGDSYSSHPMNGALYMAGHPHVCSNIGGYHEHNPRVHRYGTALSLSATGTVGRETLFNSRVAPDGTVVHKDDKTAGYPSSGTLLQGKPAPSLLNWFPTMTPGGFTGQGQAGWSVTGNDQYLVYGGEFPRVNGTGQQGLVRYAVSAIAPDRIGPDAAGLRPAAASPQGGMARVTWTSTNDRDDEHLTYQVFRDGDTRTPVHEVTQSSLWWRPQSMGFVDVGVPAGTHTYRVSAVDAAGNRANSPWVSVDVAEGTVVQRTYSDAVRADRPQHYWPLGERSGGTAYDHAGAADLPLGGGVTPGEAGAVSGDPDTAYGFDGTSAGLLATQTAVPAPNTFTLETWVRTTTTLGGKIIGFGSAKDGISRNRDRHVYMDVDGSLHFGVYTGTRQSVSAPGSYNDGQWHHVVATLSPAGMALYVDGALAGSRADVTTGQSYTGHWRIGGDRGWVGADYWTGQVDEVAVYPTAVSADQVADHFSIGTTGQPVNAAPTAAFTSSVADLGASFDASGSADSDGTVAGYAWDFGDGTTGTGATAQHTYAAAGTYTVTLTVTDDAGATAQQTGTVTVTDPPNAVPTASFTASVADLEASFDASGSTDPDGTVAGYAWDFGDGATGTGATAQHTYAAAGEYTVTLTVTDDDGATASSSRVVAATDPADPGDGGGTGEPLVTDTFDRSVTRGLGTAEVGGPWTASAGATRQSVSAGAAVLALAPGTNTGSHLGEVAQTSVDVRTTMALAQVPSGGGAYLYVPVRRLAANQEYRARVRVLADGSVRVAFIRVTGAGTDTLVGGEQRVAGLTYTAGTALQVRVQAEGVGTTELAATVWAAGTAEPATATVTRSDSTAAPQAPGAVGLFAYLSGSARAVALSVDSFTAVPNGAPAPQPEPEPNAAPTASFTSSVADLGASFDASGSTDPDGTVTGYAWDFGDGTTGTGATAQHTYAAAGEYTVTLTVTDDGGATATSSRGVTVTEPADPVDPVDPVDPGAPVAADAFGRTVTGGLGTADVGGPWTAQYGASRQSVTPGAATLRLDAPSNSTASHLGQVSQADIDLRTTLTLEGTVSGGGVYAYVSGRRISATDLYRARLRYLTDGTVRLAVTRLSGSSTEVLVGREVVVPGVSSTAGAPLHVRLQISGSGTTELAATVWAAGTAEPAAATVTRTDATASLQAPGGVGVGAYLSGSATSPVALRVSEFGVQVRR
ncbi:PKD domain-containing protein [Geodermatophilus sp. DSM 44513]|uniref:PKD domain-containing protein n=1 Tax=Geodermatophilus sp. DSM 44513 TaxID=1528104 RepID=UPI0012776D3B|nr:PKD domain-containing protein [Geodermatophilus sp. DSM 44513]WNV76401.1 PKD domain-containing protein [Geodermatophilus sp. DSM 44513]